MTVAGKAKRLLSLAVPLSTTALAVAAITTPTPALASSAARAAAAGPRPPATQSAVAGYVWWDNSTPDSYYDYNSTGGGVSVAPVGTGEYQVTFSGMGSIAGSAIVQVSTYGSADNCAVGGWGAANAGADLQASVDCFNMTTGAADNSEFDLMVTRPTAAPSGTFDYSYVYKTTASGTLTSYQYNSSGKKNSVKFLGTGTYQVTLGGPKTTGTAGIVKVSAYGNEPGDCELVKWYGSSAGEVVDVDCFTYTHTAQDRAFMVTYASANNLMGQNGSVDANAFANSKSAVYQPAVQYDSAHGARVTVVHYSTGYYEVLPAGSAGNIATWGGDVQVNAVGTAGDHCVIDGWAQQLTPSLDISCYNKNGNGTNSPFTVEWVVP